MTAAEQAKNILNHEIYYWGQKGLETTQRCSQKSALIRSELIRMNADESLLDFWIEVNKEIYKQSE
jgi:hypothetical protein